MRDDDGVLPHQRSIREAKNTKHVNSLVLYNAIKDDDGMIQLGSIINLIKAEEDKVATLEQQKNTRMNERESEQSVELFLSFLGIQINSALLIYIHIFFQLMKCLPR